MRFVDFSNPYYFQEDLKSDSFLDKKTIDIIKETDLKLIAQTRRCAWEKFNDFAILNNLEPVFKSVHPESSPWAFPVYVDSIEQRNDWLKWGIKKKIYLFTWPTFPKTEIEKMILRYISVEQCFVFR